MGTSQGIPPASSLGVKGGKEGIILRLGDLLYFTNNRSTSHNLSEEMVIEELLIIIVSPLFIIYLIQRRLYSLYTPPVLHDQLY